MVGGIDGLQPVWVDAAPRARGRGGDGGVRGVELRRAVPCDRVAGLLCVECGEVSVETRQGGGAVAGGEHDGSVERLAFETLALRCDREPTPVEARLDPEHGPRCRLVAHGRDLIAIILSASSWASES